MRPVLIVLSAALVVASSAGSLAQETKKRFGSWEVSIDTDRFEGKSKIIASTVQAGNVLAVRCFPNGVSVVVGELGFGSGRFDEGMEFEIKFRADKNDIIETSGMALNDRIVQIEDSAPMARQMRDAKEAAFRLSYRGVTVDKVFKLKGSGKALAEIFNACPDPA
ncbi:hypothetical protein [Ancylobacter sp. TS-1]|uniref:hypothetical protein n=1 Tax=Ancylobacter sp. TS-1 TaxID=1850374 RepID=UPI001265CAE0|nr:hypothetical protein [Ancylobacter sp. TS-1]QFR32748.1 hypothetical protein GBB76_06185 [Ancylobacter sp. TS-1]